MAIEKYVLPLKEITPISEGGTGATTVEQARENLGIDSLPVGTSIMYNGDTPPDGYLAENGAGLKSTTYPKLFAVIGTTFGSGDGVNTDFNLPNRNNGSFPEGSNTVGTVKSAGLPDLQGSVSAMRHYAGTHAGVFADAFSNPSSGYGGITNVSDTSLGNRLAYFRASAYDSIYGNSTTVQPKSVTVKFCIKY